MDRFSERRVERLQVERDGQGTDAGEPKEDLHPGVFVEEVSHIDDTQQPSSPSSMEESQQAAYSDSFGQTGLQEEHISPYIGETEKNLSGSLGRAEDLDDVSMFDEADALFGKRTEVRDSHDRFANLEASNGEGSGTDAPNAAVAADVAVRDYLVDRIKTDNAEQSPGAGFVEAPVDQGEEVRAESGHPEIHGSNEGETAFFRPEIGDEVLVDRAGFVEVPADSAQAATSGELAGNDNEWRATQDQQATADDDPQNQPQLEPGPQGFIINKLEEHGWLADDELVPQQLAADLDPSDTSIVFSMAEQGTQDQQVDVSPSAFDPDRAVSEAVSTEPPVSPAGPIPIPYPTSQKIDWTDDEQIEESKLEFQEVSGLDLEATSPEANLLEEKPRLHDDQGLENPVAFNEPLEFKSVAGMDSETEVIEARSDDENPAPEVEADVSNVMVGMGQKDAFMEQADPLAGQIDDLQVPVLEYIDVDIDDSLFTNASDDDDGFDVT